jgi:UDP-N-acetylmuramyl pentapeptide synthase
VRHYEGTIVTFGFDERNDLFATDIEWDHAGTRFHLNGSRRVVTVPMIGRHSAANALAALAVARRMGVSEEEAIADLAHSSGPDMRMQRHELGTLTIINDAYNANPNSMKAALETVGGLPASGRRVAILGDMRELGAATERYHRELGTFAAGCKFDLLLCVGDDAKLYAEAAHAAGMDEQAIHHYGDAKQLAGDIERHVRKDDLVLLKASRGMRLEEIAQVLIHGQERGARLAAG